MLEEKLDNAIMDLIAKHVEAKGEAKLLRMDEELPKDLRKEGLIVMRKEEEFISDLRKLWELFPLDITENKSQFISRRIDELLGETKAIMMKSNNDNSEYIRYTMRCIQGFLDFVQKRNGA